MSAETFSETVARISKENQVPEDSVRVHGPFKSRASEHSTHIIVTIRTPSRRILSMAFTVWSPMRIEKLLEKSENRVRLTAFLEMAKMAGQCEHLENGQRCLCPADHKLNHVTGRTTGMAT